MAKYYNGNAFMFECPVSGERVKTKSIKCCNDEITLVLV